MSDIEKKIGLLAGAGEVPAYFSRQATQKGIRIIAVSFSDKIHAKLEPLAEKSYSLGIGKPGKILKTIKDENITSPKDIPWLEDLEGNAELSLFDEWKAGTSPEEYASLVDQYNGPGLESDDDDERRWNMSESKGFSFDKFMKDINGREDKITQHKKELTENDGDGYTRTVQKLYQEDWRNSTKFKRNK